LVIRTVRVKELENPRCFPVYGEIGLLEWRQFRSNHDQQDESR
jgi:hypothetical protein